MKQMSITDLKKVKDFYDNVIMQQIIKPLEINEILLLVNPKAHTMQPYFKKMREITLFVQKYKGEVLESFKELMEDTKPIENDPRDSGYVHPTKSEDMPPEEQSHQEVINFDTELDLLIKGLEKLDDTPENKKARTVLKSKITKLKKK